MIDKTTRWKVTAVGFGREAGQTLSTTMDSEKAPTELKAAAMLVVAAGQRGKLVPSGTQGASKVTRLHEWGFKDITIEQVIK